jgi:aryl-alcohol dehydrogenase-like predicted oxidoreductase
MPASHSDTPATDAIGTVKLGRTDLTVPTVGFGTTALANPRADTLASRR